MFSCQVQAKRSLATTDRFITKTYLQRLLQNELTKGRRSIMANNIEASRGYLDALNQSQEFFLRSANRISLDVLFNVLLDGYDEATYLYSSDSPCDKNSKKTQGHRCYTWTRSELKKIGLDVPKNTLDRIIAAPDFVISPEAASPETKMHCVML